jgi:4-amino-4-deoxy-L-arabinose transferase-like glycosyltransferase
MQIQLAYAFTYMASGWENAYLARLLPALLSVGALAATYLVGRALHGKLAGWIGMLLLATMPTFARWASAGYVDLPMAYFYTLAALFAWRLWQADHPTDALLAGLLIGLAAWTKNAALIGVILLAAWLVWGMINRRIRLQTALISLLTCVVIAAPWYIRNQIGAGFIMPDTAWTDQAQRSLETLFIFVTRWPNYGLSGVVILAAVVAALIHLVRRRLRSPEDALLVGWTLPFFIVWWLLASYDPRFLLLFMPLLCALAGRWSALAWHKLSEDRRRPLLIASAAALVALTAYNMWISVEYKRAILQDPLMDHAAKLEIVQPTQS